MGKVKNIAVIMLAAVLAFCMTFSAFAENGGEEGLGEQTAAKGSITVTNTVAGQTYTIYRIFEVVIDNETAEPQNYTVDPSWADFFNDPNSGVSDYIRIDNDTGYAHWNRWQDSTGNIVSSPAKGEGDVKAVGMSDFAKLALQYAKKYAEEHKNDSPPKSLAIGEKTCTEDDNGTITFTDLELGYYLVDSPMGAMCGLDSTTPQAVIQEKNSVPALQLEVLEDNEYNQEYRTDNTVQIGDTVTFRATITAGIGAENYCYYSELEPGFTIENDNITSVEKNGTAIDIDKFAVSSASPQIAESNQAFKIDFTESFCDSLEVDDTVVITYTSKLNSGAVIGSAGNKCIARLDFGDSFSTVNAETVTRTWEIQIIKTDYGNSDGSGDYNILSGAQFKLYPYQYGNNSTTESGEESQIENQVNPIQLVFDSEKDIYRVATPEEISDESVFKVETITAGTPIIQGLDTNVYYLVETKEADNCYPLSTQEKAATEIIVTGDNKAQPIELVDGNIYRPIETGGGVWIKNNKKPSLPVTGGKGMLILTAVGCALIMLSVISLHIYPKKERTKEKKIPD